MLVLKPYKNKPPSLYKNKVPSSGALVARMHMLRSRQPPRPRVPTASRRRKIDKIDWSARKHFKQRTKHGGSAEEKEKHCITPYLHRLNIQGRYTNSRGPTASNRGGVIKRAEHEKAHALPSRQNKRSTEIPKVLLRVSRPLQLQAAGGVAPA